MTIYLDNMAATPVDPRVADIHRTAMLDHCGNAHSAEHSVGALALEAIDSSAALVNQSLGRDGDAVTFTPGASAALWLALEDAIARPSGRSARIAATAVEHPSLLSALRTAERDGRIELVLLPVDATCSPRLDVIEAALADGVDLLCAMAANNETGAVTDIAAIVAMAGRHGTRLLVDASQAAGRTDMVPAASADLVVISGAKAYGPRRVGALVGTLTPHASRLAHDVFGSPDVPGAVALAHAMLLRTEEGPADEVRIGAMRDTLQQHLVDVVPGLVVNRTADRLAGSLHVSTPHIPGDAAVARLWGRVAVSTGAACQSGAPGPSHVLTAMGLDEWVAEGAVRIGVGRFNTPDEIEEAAALIGSALAPEPARRRA